MSGTPKKRQSYVKFLVYCLAVVLVNVVGISLFFRIDLTADDKYSLSPASREVLAKISEPLTIKVFFTRGLPAPHNITEQYLHDLMTEYAAYGDDRFNYQFFDVTPEDGGETSRVAADQKLAEDYGVFPVQVQNIEADEVKVKKAYMGLVIIYGDMVEKITPIRSTDGLEYQITSAIRKLADKVSAFATLPEKVDVVLVLSSALYPVAPFMGLQDLAALPEAVREIVSELNGRLAGKLNYIALDPTKDPKAAEKMKSLDLLRLQWPDIPQQGRETIPAGEGTIGLALRYGDNTAVLPVLNIMDLPFFGRRYALTETSEMAAMIEASLASLIGINDDIGYLAGHGAPNANTPNTFGQQPASEDSLINLRQLLARDYTFTNFQPADLDRATCDCLIIARPTEPFSDYELFQIDQYLMRGKNLAVFLDPYQHIYPDGQPSPYTQPRSVPINTGLEKLLAHYGVRIKPAIVMDEACFKRPADQRFGQGEQSLFFAPLIKNEYINNRPAFMNNIRGLVAMNVAPLELLTDTLESSGITATTLFSSSRRSWENQGPVATNPMFIQKPGPDTERRSYPLACLLEGAFTSYFAGKPVPVKEDAADEEAVGEAAAPDAAEKSPAGDVGKSIEASGRVVAKGQPARIFVMGSSEMLYDHMLDPEGRTPNAVFVMNLLDSLNNRDKVAQLRSKGQVYNPIREVGGPSRSLIKWGNIAGLPVLVILTGCLVWFRRLSRKRHIRMMFSK